MKKNFCKFITTIVFVFIVNGNLFSDQSPPKIGLLITAFNRPDYLTLTLRDLLEKRMGQGFKLEIVIIDDGSGVSTESLIDSFHDHKFLVVRIRMPENSGIAKVLSLGWEILANRGCDYLCNLDSDALLKDDWMETLLRTYKKASDELKTTDMVVTGFNTKNHLIIKEYPSFYTKTSIGGINFFFPISMFNKYMKNALARGNGFDWILVRLSRENNFPLVCTKPSVIQHIGLNGMHSQETFDQADDFHN